MALFGFRRAPRPAIIVPDDQASGALPPRERLMREPSDHASPPLAPRAPRRTDGLLAPGEAFTPTQPKTGRRRLIGRETELRRILQALHEDRAHVVLYSERGRGKTSLSNMVVEAVRRSGTIVARHTCEAGTTFDGLMRGLMRDLPQSLLAARVGPSAQANAGGGRPGRSEEEGCVAALPSGEIRPRDVVTLPSRLNCRSLVCVVDEFDRVEDLSTRTRLADTIKQLSDGDVPLLFLIVGVSENLDQILGQHPSIQRAVLGVQLPLFSDRDVAQLIARGSRETGIAFPPGVVARVTVLARGMPYMAQLLGLRLTQAATARGDTTVLEADFEEAVSRLLEDANTRVLALYGALTTHGRDAEMVLALRRIATAPQDPWGRIVVVESADGSAMVGGRAISAACWEQLKAARVLQPAIEGSELYMFAERSLMHHALLLAARDVALPETLGPEARNVAVADGLSIPDPAQRQPDAGVGERRGPDVRASNGQASGDWSHETRSALRSRIASMSRG